MVHIMIAILLMGDILQMQLTVYIYIYGTLQNTFLQDTIYQLVQDFSIHEEYKLYMDTSWLVQP